MVFTNVNVDGKKALDADQLIRRILWGKVFFDIDDKTHILRSLSTKEQNYIDYVYSNELDKARDSSINLISDNELKVIYHRDGLWTYDDEKAIDKFKKEINTLETQKAGVKVTAKNKIAINKINRKIKALERILNDLTNKKYDLFKESAESRADEQTKRWLAFFTLENIDETATYKSFEDFEQTTDLSLVIRIVNKYYSSCFLDQETIRWVARNGSWRYKWQMAKEDVNGLFNRSVTDLTFDQSNLIYWSQAYDIVYSSYERPPKRIIENDQLLDNWFEEQGNKSEKDTLEKYHNFNQTIPAGKVGNAELFIMAGSQEEADEINSLNSAGAKVKKQIEKKKLQAAGGKPISEVDLRKKDLLMQARANAK